VSVVARIDDQQQRHGWLGFPIAVVYKFFDDQGTYLAALIAYYAFLSLFPLLLLFVTVLGYVLHGNASLQHSLVGSVLSEFPIIGTQIANNVRSLHGSGVGLAVGIIGTIYGGLGVAQAGQNAFNEVWSVPRNERPNPIKSRLRSLLLLSLLGSGALVTTTLSALGASSGSFGAHLGVAWRLGAILVSIAVNVGLFEIGFRVGTAREIRTRDVLVGAICAALAWQALQTLGTYYIAHKFKGATEVYGVFGLVLGLVAWLYLEAVVIVFCAEINVVRVRRLWPRALLTPFTDSVDLTDADERAYTSYADSESYKGFEKVDVSFGDPPHRDRPDHDEQPAREGSAPREDG
jgi:YihY family inner membrane protein